MLLTHRPCVVSQTGGAAGATDRTEQKHTGMNCRQPAQEHNLDEFDQLLFSFP